MPNTDDTGSRGEAIFFVLLTRSCDRAAPFFRPHFLGEKFATLDFFVELADAGPSTPFFFVQVKSTVRGYRFDKSGGRHLRVQVSAAHLSRLNLYPAPTYLVGIDEPDETGYIVSANAGGPNGWSSLPTIFPLDCHNLQRLWQEVATYWTQRDMSLTNSVFTVG